MNMRKYKIYIPEWDMDIAKNSKVQLSEEILTLHTSGICGLLGAVLVIQSDSCRKEGAVIPLLHTQHIGNFKRNVNINHISQTVLSDHLLLVGEMLHASIFSVHSGLFYLKT